MDLTLRQLRVLREVAARGTIAAAAESLGYTASALSQQLAGLERVAGTPVLERIGRGVTLTDAGRVLASHADEVLAKVDEAGAAVEAVTDGPAGEVRLAVFESFATHLTGPLLARLRAVGPALSLRSRELDPDVALDELLMGRVDLAVVLDYAHAPSPRPRGVEVRRLLEEPFRLVVPAGSDITGPVDLADVADRPFVASAPESSCGRCTVNACRDAGFDPDVHHVVDKISPTLHLVAAGAGIALLPDLALAGPPAGVRVLDLARPVHRTIELAVRPASLARPSIRATIEAIEDVVAATRSAPLVAAGGS